MGAAVGSGAGSSGNPLAAEWPASILIADDDPTARRLLRRVLEGAGYTVAEAPEPVVDTATSGLNT